MKKILLGIVLVGIIFLSFFTFRQNSPKKGINVPLSTPTGIPLQQVAIAKKTLFVPYWTVNGLMPGYHAYAYFGVTPTDKGTINITNNGYKNLPAFTGVTQNSQTALVVSMLTNAIDAKILQNNALQQTLIQQSIATAKTYGFSGIILDLEYKALAFPDVTKSITDFSLQFAKNVRSNGLSYYQMFPGDTFYLGRPYDVGKITAASDGIFIMTYDFHKANGTPGPNFPLYHLPDADYDFSDMLSDFSKVVPKNKITIVFGMFGYDWTVDGQGRPEKTAQSLTTKQIEQKFLEHCPFFHCNIDTNNALEKNITYVDAKNQRHIVWFETMQSVEKKEQVLQQQGISRIGFWANGYF